MEKIIETTLKRSEMLLKTERWIAFVLRYGVILCAGVIAYGFFLRIFQLVPRGGDSGQIIRDLTSGHILTAVPVSKSFSEFRVGLSQADPDVIISLGLLMLIALPVLRVGMTVVLFVIERDWIYLGITLFVLAALLAGVSMGRV